MHEYIKKEDILKHLEVYCTARYPVTYWFGLQAAINEIQKFKSVDAVEVVRCKNCIHRRDFDGRLYCNIWVGTNDVGAEGFCNYGYEKEKA